MSDMELITAGSGCMTLPRTQIEMRGADRSAFLHNLCTNDVKRLQPGEGCEAFVTDVRGKTIGHVIVFAEAESLWIDTEPNQSATLVPHFEKYHITEDVEVADRTADFGEIILFGSDSTKALTRLGLPAPAELYTHCAAECHDRVVSVRRVSMTSLTNYLLQCNAEDLEVIFDALVAAGVHRAASELFETARIEHGWPKYGQDFSADNLPQELRRDAAAISFTKGCYLGQETVARIDAMGHVNKQIVQLRFDGTVVPTVGSSITAEDKEVGTLTSSISSSSLTTVALGIVRSSHAQVGTRLKCGDVSVEVVELA